MLAFEERRAEVRFIIDGATANIVLPVEPGFSRIAELVLTAPDEPSWAWQASLEPKIIARPEAEEAVDRWTAYHGAPRGGSVWMRARVTGLKSTDGVWGEDQLAATNPLRACEPRLIKNLNADRAALVRACKVHGPIDVADPLAVGIDPFGVDVRARFGIVRLEFPENIQAASEPLAQRAVDFLLARRPWREDAP